MKIISGGKKDYYDYLVGIYGMDEDIVYDRRDCEVIRDCLTTNYYLMRFFTKFNCYDDAYKAERKQYNGKWETVLVGKFYSFILEIGFTKYVYEIERYLEDGKVKIDYKLLNKFENQTKFVDAPIGIVPLRFGNQLSNGRFVDETSWDIVSKIAKQQKNHAIKNPILNNTWIVKEFPAEDMYNAVYNYLINVREPEIVDLRNDIQKLESKGFDKVTSFRNPINKRK